MRDHLRNQLDGDHKGAGGKGAGGAASKRKALPIAISSGKGGVGKTNITTNLGIALAKSGKSVCVVDGDTSLANINILLNITPVQTLDHYLKGDCSLNDILLSGPSDLHIVPSATGITDYLQMTPNQHRRLLGALEQLEDQHDYLLIDTAAGISDSVTNLIESAQYAIIVVSPEPTSLTDAFSLIKVLQRKDYQQPIYILVNLADSYAHSMEVFKRFARATNKYLKLKVRYLGYLPVDSAVREAVAAQNPVVLNNPESPAARCIDLLANILLKHFSSGKAPVRQISQFWRRQIEQIEANTAEKIDIAESIASQEKPVQEAESAHAELETGADASILPIESNAGTDAEPQPVTELPASNVNTDAAPEDNDNIVDITGSMPDIEKLSQQQTEDLLAQFIKHYLTAFGVLPQQAIDLVLQAHAQEQLPDGAIEQLYSQLQQSITGNTETTVGKRERTEKIQENQDRIIQEDNFPESNVIEDNVHEGIIQESDVQQSNVQQASVQQNIVRSIDHSTSQDSDYNPDQEQDQKQRDTADNPEQTERRATPTLSENLDAGFDLENTDEMLSIGQQIDSLFGDARQSKQHLFELAKQLRTRYKEIYNQDIFPPRAVLRPLQGSRTRPGMPAKVSVHLQEGSTERSAKKHSNERSSDPDERLQQNIRNSIRYAAAVDRRKR